MHFPEITIPEGTPEFAAGYLKAIDAAATEMAIGIMADSPRQAELRASADDMERSGRGSPWLVETRRDRADLIEVDARLEAARLIEATTRDGHVRFFMHKYVRLVQQAAERRAA